MYGAAEASSLEQGVSDVEPRPAAGRSRASLALLLAGGAALAGATALRRRVPDGAALALSSADTYDVDMATWCAAARSRAESVVALRVLRRDVGARAQQRVARRRVAADRRRDELGGLLDALAVLPGGGLLAHPARVGELDDDDDDVRRVSSRPNFSKSFPPAGP